VVIYGHSIHTYMEGDDTASRDDSETESDGDQFPDVTTDSLDPSQLRAYNVAMSGKNVFLTGGPGTGKSHTCKVIISALKKLHKGGVRVVAPTGVAALILGGRTMQADPGPRVVDHSTGEFDRMEESESNRKQWLRTKVLIVDEISMVDAEFFEWYIHTIKRIKDKRHLQVILCGDFSQLPPVCTKAPSKMIRNHVYTEYETSQLVDHHLPFGTFELKGKYAFQTACWRDMELHVCNLERVHRTSDSLLLDALSDIRVGRSDTNAVKALVKYTNRAVETVNGVTSTILYATNKEANVTNETELLLLDQTTKHEYESTDSFVVYDSKVDSIRKEITGNDLTPTPVMQGLIAIRVSMFSLEKVQTHEFYTKLCQAPKRLELRVGCQVMLLQNQPSRGVALRKRLVNGSRGTVIGFVECNGREWPEVMFRNGERKVCMQQKFDMSEYRTGRCVRIQVPLRLAWATTIHKSQGMTIDSLHVDLNCAFELGHAYVAISRAESIDGLQISNFTPKSVKTNAMMDKLNKAIASGSLREYVAVTPTWWQPIMGQSTWRKFYLQHSVFKAWNDAYPQTSYTKKRQRDEDIPDSDVSMRLFVLNGPSGYFRVLHIGKQAAYEGDLAVMPELLRAYLPPGVVCEVETCITHVPKAFSEAIEAHLLMVHLEGQAVQLSVLPTEY
jgi:ATP-dependent exoDNAse (exonuclease V) alpha subunit